MDALVITQPNGVELRLYPADLREPDVWEQWDALDYSDDPAPPEAIIWPPRCRCGWPMGENETTGGPVVFRTAIPASEVPDGCYLAYHDDGGFQGILTTGSADVLGLALCQRCADGTVIDALLGEVAADGQGGTP